MPDNDDQVIIWQLFEVRGGLLSRNEAGQFTGTLVLSREHDLEVANWLTLMLVFDETGAKWGWRPEEPEFAPDFQEE